LPAEIDTSVPSSARIWNYWLGGKDNFPVDQAAGNQFREVFPGIVDVARTSRRFLTRAVRYLAGQAQVRQFLDIGTGLPIDRLLAGLPSGSYLIVCDGSNTDTANVEAQKGYNQSGAIPYRLRSPEQIAGFFDGLELIEPGVVSSPRWRPDPVDGDLPAEVDALCGVARKP
jgi:hypothetical protein